MNIIFLTDSESCDCAVPKDMRTLSHTVVSLSCSICGWAETASLSPCTIFRRGQLGAVTEAIVDGFSAAEYCKKPEDGVLAANNPEEPK